jgi:hypothetical protein
MNKVKVKYRNKIYSSEDIPIFFYFKEVSKKDEFITFLANNSLINEYKQIPAIHAILAGNTIIKDKRARIYLSFDEDIEKKVLQKSIFFNPQDSNAFLCSPSDIEERNLEIWIEKYIDSIK